MWEHDSLYKLIDHAPGCSIPLMSVNENNDTFQLFSKRHANRFIDNTNNNPILLNSDGLGNSLSHIPKEGTNTDQQPVDSPFENCKTPILFLAGDIIRATTDDATFIVIIAIIAIIYTQYVIAYVTTRYKYRPLKSKKTMTLTPGNMTAIRPDPVNIHSSPANIDRETMTHFFTKEDMKQL